MIPLDAAPEPEPEEALLRSFLLKTLAEDQQAVVSGLLADYAAGQLSAAEAAVVRGWLASSPTVRARLAVIRELQAATQSARRTLRSKARH